MHRKSRPGGRSLPPCSLDMIDLHCHILPALDDGPKVIEESVEMARVANAKGIRAVAASPHVIETQSGILNRERIEQALAQLRERLAAEGISLELRLGAEYYLSQDFPRLMEKHFPLASLAGTRYVLVEIPMSHVPPYLEYSTLHSGIKNPELLRELPYLRPILAHPERYLEVLRNIKTAERFRALGYILQVNLGSLAGRYGRSVRKTAEKMIQGGLVDLVATDAHSASALAEVLDGGLKRLRKVAGEEGTRLLTEENPGRVLQGQPLRSLQEDA